MELKWLEDYLALLDCQNFTTAASMRNLSQPAFSRRIQALESWLGSELIDRRKKPFQFTPTAIEHEATIRKLVNQIYYVRNQLKSSIKERATITVAAQHSLLATPFLPRFLEKLATSIKDLHYRVTTENMESCVAMFLKGEADMLIAYQTIEQKPLIPGNFCLHKKIGSDEMILVASPTLMKTHQNKVNRTALPLLVYPISSFFGSIVWAEELPKALSSTNATISCESSFAIGLREMALASTGAAWVPRSIVLKDIKANTLIELDQLSTPIAMDVVAHISTLKNSSLTNELKGFF